MLGKGEVHINVGLCIEFCLEEASVVVLPQNILYMLVQPCFCSLSILKAQNSLRLCSQIPHNFCRDL